MKRIVAGDIQEHSADKRAITGTDQEQSDKTIKRGLDVYNLNDRPIEIDTATRQHQELTGLLCKQLELSEEILFQLKIITGEK